MVFLLLLGLLAVATPLRAQNVLSDADVDAAIAEGTKSQPKPVGCYADARFAEALGSEYSKGYSVILRGPFFNIANKAAEAKQKYLNFTRDDVTEEMRMAALTAVVHPAAPEFASKRWRRAAPANHLVMRISTPNAQQEPAVIQPTRVETYPMSWNNALGMKFDGQGVIAIFDLTAVPVDHDVEFVVITDQGERDCKLSKNDRARVK